MAKTNSRNIIIGLVAIVVIFIFYQGGFQAAYSFNEETDALQQKSLLEKQGQACFLETVEDEFLGTQYVLRCKAGEIITTEGETIVAEVECDETSLWMKITGKECIDGQIIEKEKEVKEPFDWREHKTTIWIIGIIIALIFIMWVFTPEKPGAAPARRIMI